MPSPSVSVIVPVYNRAQLIGQTLQALLAQKRPADEIIVVDDGSTDESANAARVFGDAVQVLQTPNAGPAMARNRGLAAARGDFIQFMDSDDLPTPEFLAARLDAIARADTDIAYGPWLPTWMDGKCITADGFVRQAAGVARALDALLQGWVLFIPNAMIRRTLLEDAGGYPEGLLTGEDMLLLFRLLRRTERLAHTARSVLLVRQHPEGQISGTRILAGRRIMDELILTGTVAAEVRDDALHPVLPSRAAIKAWDRRRARAFALARRANVVPPDNAGSPPSSIAEAFAAASDLFGRLEARVRFHRFGHRLSPHFHPMLIGPDHLEEVRALGLELLPSGQAAGGNCGGGVAG